MTLRVRVGRLDTPEAATELVVVEDRAVRGVELVDPLRHHFRLVVIALNERMIALVTDAVFLRLAEDDVVSAIALPVRAHPATGETNFEILLRSIQEERELHALRPVTKEIVEQSRLRIGARETVDHCTTPVALAAQFLSHHRQCDFIGNETASIHDRFDHFAESGSLSDFAPEEVAGREMREIEGRSEFCCKRAFACARTTKQNDVSRRSNRPHDVPHECERRRVPDSTRKLE